jgi:hypothetical protein
MRTTQFSRGWDEERLRRVLDHYEQQTEEEASQKIKRFMKILIKTLEVRTNLL